MPQYIAFTSPSKAEVMTAAVVAKLSGGLTGWSVKRASSAERFAALLAQTANWPTAAQPLCVVFTDGRAQDPETGPVTGTTAEVWLVTLTIAVVVYDASDETRPTTLDAKEVLVINLLHQLERDTDFAAARHKPVFTGSTPIAITTEGNAAPLAGSRLELTANVHE